MAAPNKPMTLSQVLSITRRSFKEENKKATIDKSIDSQPSSQGRANPISSPIANPNNIEVRGVEVKANQIVIINAMLVEAPKTIVRGVIIMS